MTTEEAIDAYRKLENCMRGKSSKIDEQLPFLQNFEEEFNDILRSRNINSIPSMQPKPKDKFDPCEV
jgi:hypothetical protein